MSFLVVSLFLLFHTSFTAPIPADLQEPKGCTSSSTLPTRSQFSVVWGCLTTLCLCGWSAIRPNAPTPTGWSRIKLLLLAVIFPEFILAWAVRQWFAAREIRDAYNAHREVGTCVRIIQVLRTHLGCTSARCRKSAMDNASRSFLRNGRLYLH